MKRIHQPFNPKWVKIHQWIHMESEQQLLLWYWVFNSVSSDVQTQLESRRKMYTWIWTTKHSTINQLQCADLLCDYSVFNIILMSFYFCRGKRDNVRWLQYIWCSLILSIPGSDPVMGSEVVSNMHCGLRLFHTTARSQQSLRFSNHTEGVSK